MLNSEFDDAYEDPERIRGALLTTSVSELLVGEPIFVDADSTVVTAVNAMNERRTGCVLVEEDGKLAGIFTERDVLTRVVFHQNDRTLKVEAVMTRNPEILEANATIAFALNMMSVGGYRHIPIVERGGKTLGVLSVRHIVDFLVDLFPDGVHNLPPSPEKEIARTLDGG